MFTRLKVNVAIIATAGLIVTATITAPFTSMFGKHYKESKDFSCCKKDQLVIHHYYTVNVFWMEVADGYTEENTGKAIPGGCNIKCND
jgi:hypothetical protein